MSIQFWFVPIALTYVACFFKTVQSGSRLTSHYNEGYDLARLRQHKAWVVSLLASVTVAVLFVHGLASRDPHMLDHKQILFGQHMAFVEILLTLFVLTVFVFNGQKKSRWHKYFVVLTIGFSLPVVITGAMLVM